MNHHTLCSHCQQLLSKRPHDVPTQFARVDRIYNHTLYHCKRCGAYFGHIHVPHRWQLMLAPPKQPQLAARPQQRYRTAIRAY